MTAPTHIVTGLATVVVVGRVTGVTPDAVSLMAIVFGSLAPDIDGKGVITRPGTILRQLIGRGSASLLDAVFEFIAAVESFFFGHQGFIHSPLLALCIFGLGGYLSNRAPVGVHRNRGLWPKSREICSPAPGAEAPCVLLIWNPRRRSVCVSGNRKPQAV